MTDPSGTVAGGLPNLVNLISAVGGLGIAAMGLVDSLKAFGGGPSLFGFGYIERKVRPLMPHPKDSAESDPAFDASDFGPADIMATLKANWINGVAEADQKAKAKALIHLGITPGNAERLAKATGVDAALLGSLAAKVASGKTASDDPGQKPSNEEINALSRFDAVLSAILDAAYERADQKYRNACKALATVVATLLALVGGRLVYGADYWMSPHMGLAILIGLLATPLAPIAKDLANSLQTAAAAVGAIKR